MSEFSAKTIREARKAKATKMGSADPHTKVDSSDWTPAEPLNADVKTGARPLSRRAFKSGGKVAGQKAKANMGRKPRCGGGKAGESWVNRNVKEANEDREGKKHVGGFKTGGRTKRAYGGRGVGERTQTEVARRDAVQAAKDYQDDPRVGPKELAAATRAFEDKKTQTGYKKGGRTKKMGGGAMMMPGAAMDPRMGMVDPNRMKFSGAQGSPYKRGGKVHSDEAEDKKLIKKMVKPSARTGKNDGGRMKYLGAVGETEAAEKEYGKSVSPLDRAMQRIENDFSPDQMRRDREALKARRETDPKFREFQERAKKRADKESMKKAGYKAGGRTAKAGGGSIMMGGDGKSSKKSGKGKTNINIIIAAGKGQQQDAGPGAPPGMPPSLQKPPAGMPPGMPPMPPGAPAGGPPAMGQPPMPPMARKSGGRITKVAKSYKDMEAGAASGEGRLQKTDIAKRIPKKKEDGVIETDKRGYPNKVIGATGGRTAHKDGGKVYRSYKDMDAGAGSGKGRLEKEEIQKRKH